MMRLTKSDLIRRVAVSQRLTLADTTAVLDAILTEISGHVAKGGTVTLTGFGVFKPHHRAAGSARVPGTHELVDYPASTRLGFTAAATRKGGV